METNKEKITTLLRDEFDKCPDILSLDILSLNLMEIIVNLKKEYKNELRNKS